MTSNWFAQGGDAYAAYRPEYPPALAAALAHHAPDRRLAVDVGCGSGQLTRLLATHFDAVIGLDPSADQLAHAVPHEKITYTCAPAERLPIADGSVGLITAAQAAHWFDLPAFYAEARRIAVPQGAIALVTYGVLRTTDPEINARFDQFYREEIGPHWPPERRLVDSGYAGIAFPFDERPLPSMSINLTPNLAGFLGYISTWSAVRRAEAAGRRDLLDAFARDMTALWGDPSTLRPVSYPIQGRLGLM